MSGTTVTERFFRIAIAIKGLDGVLQVVAALILSYLPIGQTAFNRLSPLEQQRASDLGNLILTLGLDLALAMAFGALIGWLGAWSLIRFRPPREPET